MNTLIKTVAFLSKSVIAGLAAAFVVVYFNPGLLQRPGLPGVSDAVDAAAPAVVNIYTLRALGAPQTNGPENRLAPNRPQRFGISLGSGVIVDRRGLIVTNNHLIEGFEVFVQLYDNRIARAIVVGRDPDTDIAVLGIDLPNLPVMKVGTVRPTAWTTTISRILAGKAPALSRA